MKPQEKTKKERHQKTKKERHHLDIWVVKNKSIFKKASPEEMEFVSEIFLVPHFRNCVRKEHLWKGMPVADPFVIASAKINQACVVTEEKNKKNSAQIPNICDHFEIDCTNLDGFMEREKWLF